MKYFTLDYDFFSYLEEVIWHCSKSIAEIR